MVSLFAYPKLIYYNQVDKGGHFAAWEQPALFASELRAAFRRLRSATWQKGAARAWSARRFPKVLLTSLGEAQSTRSKSCRKNRHRLAGSCLPQL
jgi:hypothetical protein